MRGERQRESGGHARAPAAADLISPPPSFNLFGHHASCGGGGRRGRGRDSSLDASFVGQPQGRLVYYVHEGWGELVIKQGTFTFDIRTEGGGG